MYMYLELSLNVTKLRLNKDIEVEQSYTCFTLQLWQLYTFDGMAQDIASLPWCHSVLIFYK